LKKKIRGAAINQAKQAIEAALNAGRAGAWPMPNWQAQLQAEALDVTLARSPPWQGGLHPVSLDAGAHRGHLWLHGL